MKDENQGTTISRNTISDTNIKWRNWMIMHKGVEEVAREVWEFGKMMGISYHGNEEEVLKRLQRT